MNMCEPESEVSHRDTSGASSKLPNVAWLIIVLLTGVSTSAMGFQFETSPEWQARWDNTFRYNAMSRVEGQDPEIVANPLFDDATLSFDKGLVSNRFDWISELDIVWKDDYGFRISGAAWYDSIYNKSNDHPPRSLTWGSPSAPVGEFTNYARDLHGRDAELLDAFVFGNFSLGNTELGVRAGRHTLYWGQTLLATGAIHGIAGAMAPIDAIKAFTVPGAAVQELFMPTTKASFSWQVTPELSFNGYYSFEFREHRLPAVGSYASPAEHFTNRAEFASLVPVPAIGLVYGQQGVGAEEPNNGEYGLAVEYYASGIDMEFGAYYLNYYDKLPHGLIAEVDLLKLPDFLGGLGGPLSGDLLPPNNVSIGRFKWSYKDNIDLLGLSFSKELWGISFGGDLVYRKNVALNPEAGAVFLGRATIPGVIDSGFDDFNESNYGGPVGDTLHLVLNAFGLLNTNALWDGGNYIVELSTSTLRKVTANEAFLNAYVKEDKVAMHIASNFTPEWYQVFPSVDMSLPISISYGLTNFAPFILAGNEEVGSASIGVNFLYKQKYRFDLRYSNSFGPVENGATTRDRDWVSFTFQVTL
jgi:hypothetical protein